MIEKLISSSIFILLLFGIPGLLIQLLRNRAKGFSAKTHAIITNLRTRKEEERDFDTNRVYKITIYMYTYEYFVDGIRYHGHGWSKFKKKMNQKIKIYYNTENPNNSATAEDHTSFLKMYILVASIAAFVYIGLRITS